MTLKKLDEKTLQELKSGILQFENLDETYFVSVSSRDNYQIGAENVLVLLNENICSFKQLVDKFEAIRDEDDDPSLYKLLENTELFEELIKSNKLNQDDLKYLLNKIENAFELDGADRNSILWKHIVELGIASIRDLIDLHKNIQDENNEPYLWSLLEDADIFKYWTENNALTQEDLKYLLNKIDCIDEIDELCNNTSLTQKILNELLLDNEFINKLNKIIEKDSANEKVKDWYESWNLHNIFDVIEFNATHYWDDDTEDWIEKAEQTIDHNFLKLIESNKLLGCLEFSKNEKYELHEMLKDNDIARNKLKELVENHLGSNYSFEFLIDYLKKKEKKNLINI